MTPAARRFCSLRELIAAIDDFSETLKIENRANWGSTSKRINVPEKVSGQTIQLADSQNPRYLSSYSFLAAAILEPFLFGRGFCDLRIRDN